MEIVESAKALAPWVAAVAALFGVILGGFINLGSQWFIDSRRRTHEAKTLRIALISEIYGIVSVVEARGYIEELSSAPQKMQSVGEETRQFSVNMPENYCPVYQANAVNIGLLKPDEASYIVGFHQIVLSVIQDVTPGGVLYNGGNAQQFGEAEALLQHAVDMGNSLAKNADIPEKMKS